MQWLNEKLIPKILKWASSDISNKNGMAEGSLNLISLEDYNDLYHELKLKYGKNIVEVPQMKLFTNLLYYTTIN